MNVKHSRIVGPWNTNRDIGISLKMGGYWKLKINGDMGYHVTDRGYWDIELFEIGILGYQIPHPGLNCGA